MTQSNKKIINNQSSLPDPTPSASSLKINFHILDFDTQSTALFKSYSLALAQYASNNDYYFKRNFWNWTQGLQYFEIISLCRTRLPLKMQIYLLLLKKESIIGFSFSFTFENMLIKLYLIFFDNIHNLQIKMLITFFLNYFRFT